MLVCGTLAWLAGGQDARSYRRENILRAQTGGTQGSLKISGKFILATEKIHKPTSP